MCARAAVREGILLQSFNHLSANDELYPCQLAMDRPHGRLASRYGLASDHIVCICQATACRGAVALEFCAGLSTANSAH